MDFHTLSNIDYFFVHLVLRYIDFITSFFIFTKTQNIKTNKKRNAIVFLINFLISLLYAFIEINNLTFINAFAFISISLTLTILIKNKKTKAFLIGLISCGFAYFIKGIAAFVTSIGMWVIQAPVNTSLPYYIECILIIILTILFLNIKRLKKGIQFFENEDNLGLGLAISGLIFIMSIVERPSNLNLISPITIASVFGVPIAGFGLYLWIKKSITKHYREKLQLKSDIHYKEMLEKKEAEIEKLNRSNEYLSKVVHRDNHLMSSLSKAIDTYKQTKSDDDKEKLLVEMQTLINERGELIQTELKESKLFPSTGNMIIDSAINDLYIKAAAHGIDFNLSVSKTVDEIIGKYISQTDLQTLICDHVKDAIIAVDAKKDSNGKILVDLSMENDNYTISVFDSGVDFEIDTLAKLGKERVTTHADNGGSGIGFMTTFETLRKSYASLIITEFENKTPFSKSVSIRFDGNTAFIIQSYRKEELKSVLNRDDIILL